MNGIRLQLLLAKAGIASRRHAEVLISQGHVSVNGRVVTQLGTRVDPVSDRISVDGKPVEQEPLAYFLLHKPKGYVTTASDPDGRPTVFDLIPDAPVRLFAVGRLDFNTEGLVHIGLLPELIEDARRDAVDPKDIEPLFRSAEAYIRMWERAEQRAAELGG